MFLKIKRRLNKAMALLLSVIMVLPNLPVIQVNADSSVKSNEISDAELEKILMQDAGQYPEGAFEFYISQLEGREGEDKLELTVVRRGERSQKASVDFKSVSVTAAYREDYTLSIKNSPFRNQVLGSGESPLTLSDAYQSWDKVKAQNNNQTEEKANDTDVKSESKAEEGKGEETKSPLQMGKDAYLQSESHNLNWTKMDEANLEETKKLSAQGGQAVEEFARNVEGVEYTLQFDENEFKKTILIDIVDDSVSETDEQAMFLLSNAVNGELAGNTTAYLNIKDNDEGEKVVFAMDADSITVNRSEGVAKIKVRRVSGVEKLASVIVSTGAADAKPDVDYTAYKNEMIFGQGVEEQTVEIPLLDNPDASKDVAFKVYLDEENSFVQEGKAETTVTIKSPKAGDGGSDPTDAPAIVSKESKENGEADQEDGMEAFAATDKKETYTLNASLTSSSISMCFLKNVDLSMADYVEITWSGESSLTAFMMIPSVYSVDINGIMGDYIYTSFLSSGIMKINLTDAMKTTNAKFELNTIMMSKYSYVNISKVAVHYPGYQFTVSNTPYTDGSYTNQYTEKIYRSEGAKLENGHRYDPGSTFTLATMQVMKGGDATAGDSVTLHSVKDQLIVRHNYNTIKNSNGVGLNASFNGNVYLVGYQLSKPGSNTWSGLIRPDNLKFDQSFVSTYKQYLHTGNEFKLRAVYRPYAANVMFQNTDAKKGSYDNGFATDEVLRCTQFDTIALKGIANTGYSVDGFNIGAYADGGLHSSSNSLNRLAELGDSYHSQTATTIKSNSKTYSSSSYTKVAVQNAKAGGAVKNIITFTPDKEYAYINMAYSTPKIDVKVDPLNNNKDKGAVIYSDGEGGVKEGNYQTPMTVTGITLNNEYKFSAVTDDDYKAYWKNFTGDVNGDGRIDVNEQMEVDKYNFVRIASNGNVYSFRPILPNSLIYYGFKPKEENRYAGYVDGVVALKTKPIFSTKEAVVPINGAQISVSGMTTTTKEDERFGGMEGTGGDGYFSISDREFVAGDNVTVNITYDNIGISAAQAVNAAGIYVLDSFDTIRVDGASAYSVSAKGEAKEIVPSNITNGDKTYRLQLITSSTNDALAARKAVFRFYRKDGTKMEAEETVQSTNGIFTLDFNPASLKIPVGSTMTVQFYDQNNRGFFEHKMDFFFAQSLGVLSFLSSFQFGGAEKAVEMIGVVNSAFNFGWDGDLDQDSKYVSNSKDGMSRTISLGFSFDYEGEMDKNDDEAEDPNKQAVKDAAGKAGTSSAQKNAQNQAADGAIDKEGKGNTSNTKIGGSASIGCSFALGITMSKSESPEHKGEWYFQEMMLCVKAAGGVTVEVTYITPIGIPIMVSVSTGASGAATFVVEQNYDKKEYYFSDIMDKSGTKIDLFDYNMKNADGAFSSYGMFNIAPYFYLGAGVGFKKLLSLELEGKADIDMNFYVNSGQKNNGSLNLSSNLKFTILGFEKNFKLASKNFNLFGNASTANVLSDQDYRYESLRSMETVKREYLKNSGKWKGSAGMNAMSLADTGAIEEHVLKEGIYPRPDIQLSDLGGGKYLGLFIDDDKSRASYNYTALYYTIFDKGEWSEPKLVEDDGTLDQAPSVFDLGDRLYIAWSTADKAFTEEPGVIENLHSMNIHGRFFDKTTLRFGDIQKITETSPYSYTENGVEVKDETADVDPKISYDKKTNRMLLFYTKSEYSSSAKEDEEGLVSDLVNPYSVLAYRSYDFTSGRWEDAYTPDEMEHLSGDYQKAWYGQRFLDLAPLAKVNETLDEVGYWTEKPQLEEYRNVTYTDAQGDVLEQEPIVMESDSITYNGLSLFTYVLDYDGNKETEQDRDVFLQIYNFADNSFTHPIMITSDDKAESNIRLVNGCSKTLLTYLSDGTLKLFNLSKAVKDRLIKDTVNGQEFYYIDRSLPEEGEEDTYYEPVKTIAGKDMALSDATNTAYDASLEEEEQGTAAAEETAALEDDTTITGFEVSATNDYIYMFWTQRKSVVKEGVDETSEEAALAENRLVETQIYGVRYDGEKEAFTNTVQITDETGMNYNFLNFVVEEGSVGTVKALATKAGSTWSTTEDADGEEVTYPVEDMDNRALVYLNFTPVSTLKTTNVSIEELTAGKDSAVSVDFRNDGFETLTDLTFVANAKDKSVIYEEKVAVKENGNETEGNTAGYIMGGGSLHFGFPITLDEDDTGAEFTYRVTNKDGKVLAEGGYQEEIPLAVDVESFDAVLTDRNTVKFFVEVANNGRRKSGEQKLSINKGSNTLCEVAIGSLMPSEHVYVEKEYAFKEYEDMFRTYQTEDDSWNAVTNFKATTGCGEEASSQIRLLATKEQRLLMNAIKKIEVVDNDTLKNEITLNEGEVSRLQTSIQTIPYLDSRYEGMDDAEYNTNNTSGLRVVYKVDNGDDDVIKLYDSGYIEAVKPGTATVTAYVTPNNNKISYNEQDGSVVEDNFNTLPEEAIQKRTVSVTVKSKNGVTDIQEEENNDEKDKNGDTDHKEVDAKEITLNKARLSLPVKGTFTLEATFNPTDTTNKKVEWKSSNHSVAEVKDGKVSAKKAGTSVITATSANGKTATCKVTVTSVTFSKKSLSIGLKEQYTMVPILSKETTDRLKKVSYSCLGNKKAVSIKKLKNGGVRITGKKKGTATIKVKTTSGATATLRLKVRNAPKKITLTKSKWTVKKNQTAQLKYRLPKNTASANVTFVPKNKKIVRVSKTGKITGLRKGKTKITVTTFNKKKATASIVVN